MNGPVFHVPDVDALELGPDPLEDPAAAAAGGPELTVLEGGAIAVTPRQVGGLVELPFAFAALRRGPHWKLSREESDLLAEPIAAMVNRHAVAARAIRAAGDPLAIAAALGILVTARLMEDAERANTDPGARAGSRRRARDDERASRLPHAVPDRDGDDSRRLDDGRPRGGLNGWGGFPAGVDDGSLDVPSPPTVPAEAPGPVLGQALNF
jgi:hypothetical protein